MKHITHIIITIILAAIVAFGIYMASDIALKKLTNTAIYDCATISQVTITTYNQDTGEVETVSQLPNDPVYKECLSLKGY